MKYHKFMSLTRSKKIYLIYGPNGAGKTTVARYLATNNSGIHIQLDWFSSMQRGRAWYTRKSNKDKVNILIGTLNAIFKKTSYKQVYVDGVLIYKFMFEIISRWCTENKINLIPIKLIGNELKLDERLDVRKKKKIKNVNKELPKIYQKFSYRGSRIIDTSNLSILEVAKKIEVDKSL